MTVEKPKFQSQILSKCGVNTAAFGLTRMKSGPGLAPRPIIQIVTQNSLPPFPSRKGTVSQLDVPGGLFE